MYLTNALNLTYRHNENGDLYTLLYQSNLNCDETQVNEMGLPKWVPTATYRSEEDGVIYSRPLTEFEQKFTLTFPKLETLLADDFALLVEKGLIKEEHTRARMNTLLGCAKELWSLFPLTEEENVRIPIIRALNFADYYETLKHVETIPAFEHMPLVGLLHTAGATLEMQKGEMRGTIEEIKEGEDVNAQLALLMISLVATIREYRYATAITVEAEKAEEHKRFIEMLIESINEMINWFESLKITISRPTLVVKVNSFDPNYLESLKGN